MRYKIELFISNINETNGEMVQGSNKLARKISEGIQECSVESEAEEFIETFSDIDYDLHVRKAKEDALIFREPGEHNLRILRPVSEDEEEVCHCEYKRLFKRCRKNLEELSLMHI